ncbi:transmembrane channel-like protein 8 isoform X3 [Sciurus carolinensis]|uniref:transmembrane channel-like protein 8 isoform X3 n=1 Tax=Sciurus carolinensis TaxID=30640 RepID=UPI001FB355B5|nr:transmembrane channel-like protein 8 isoform X3 [Sciurus carolinensis]
MLRQWSGQSGQGPREKEPQPAGEELWEQEMEQLCASRAPLRTLPYAMVDKRFIRQLREPNGVKTSRWQRWQRRRQIAGRRLGEAAQRLAQGFGLWEGALYEIGGLFGTGIQSYFTFLRFLLLLNLLTLGLTASVVLLPLAWLRPPGPGPAPAQNLTLQCPGSHQPHTGIPKFHNQLWNILTGRAFNNTYLFYGGYRAGPESSSAYSIRLAYLLSPLACLLLCFCGTLQRMVKGLPQRPLLGQAYRTPLSAKLFSSWDFCIRVREAATIKKHEISNEFKAELEEGRRLQLAQQRSPTQRACHLLTFLGINILIGLLVVGAISAIFWATKYSQDNKEEALFVVLQYLPPGVIALVNFLGPLLFAFLVQLENYPPSTEVNLTLIWLLVERFSGRFWTWLDREEFLVPKNVLDIVAGQTATWMGLFFCPLLPLLNSIFLFLTFYIKKYTLLRNSRASSRLLRASSSTFFFQLVLLLGLLLAAVPLGYVVSSTHSSWDCGLFANYSAPWQVVPELVALRLPLAGQRVLHYLSSHAFSFPLLILLSLVLTVCVSQSQANARAIHGLRKQLVWQVQEKWHLVEDLSRLLPELAPSDSLEPESPLSRASRPRSFCPGFPCPGSPGPRTPRPGSSHVVPTGLSPPYTGPRDGPGPSSRFRFPSGSAL